MSDLLYFIEPTKCAPLIPIRYFCPNDNHNWRFDFSVSFKSDENNYGNYYNCINCGAWDQARDE